jgi:hypothetical protein
MAEAFVIASAALLNDYYVMALNVQVNIAFFHYSFLYPNARAIAHLHQNVTKALLDVICQHCIYEIKIWK